MVQNSFSLDRFRISWQKGQLDIHESRGFFHISEQTTSSLDTSIINIKEESQKHMAQVVAGDSSGAIIKQILSPFEIRIGITTPTEFSKTTILYAAHPEESIFGCGTQLSKFNLKGTKLPVLTREPGIGRGVQPLTSIMEHMFGAGGAWHCSSAPAAWFVSTEGFGLCVENQELIEFDFSNPQEHRITVHAHEIHLRIVFGDTPKSILMHYTEKCGRFPALPNWMHNGAIIGMQGGSEKVRNTLTNLEANNVPISAFWLQDWVGGRKTSIGKQLWWNWEIDRTRYPDWEALRDELHQKNIKILSYINPFLVDSSAKGTVQRMLLAEAKENGYLVHNEHGEPYPIQNTSFYAYLIDLSNPQARYWIKSVIKEQLIESGVHGWMADFAEALPFDAKLYSGSTAEWHNRYPVEWASVNREAIQEAGKEGEILFFHRSGFTQSPKFSTLMWMGDQLADWGREDGLHSAVIGLLSSGFSGFSINHGDIGGYIATTPPWMPFSLPWIGFKRTKELLLRWVECFSCTAVFRTHEGNQPTRHVQIDHDAETLAHFAKFARLFQALAEYRDERNQEAQMYGFPVVRSLAFSYPECYEQRNIDTQFFLGDDVLMAPVLLPKTNHVRCFVPTDGWRHCWSQQIYNKGTHTILAPIGLPCILSREGSSAQKALLEYVCQEGCSLSKP